MVNVPTRGARERNCVPHVRDVEQPSKQPLKPHAECDVWHASGLVYVDNEVVARVTELTLLAHPLVEHLGFEDFLGNSTQFAVAAWSDEISHLGNGGIFLVNHIRKRLDVARDTHDPEWTIEELCELLFVLGRDADTENGIGSLCLDMGDRIFVGDTRERSLEVVGTQGRAQVFHLLRALLGETIVQVAQ